MNVAITITINIILNIWFGVIDFFIWSYLRKSNENLVNEVNINVMYMIYLLLFSLLHITNTISEAIVSVIWIGNCGIFSPSGYITYNGPLYGIP